MIRLLIHMGYMEQGEGRPQPKFQQPGERSSKGIPPDSPKQTFDLLGNIKAFVELERKQFDASKRLEEKQFNTADWMSERLAVQVEQAYFAYGGKKKEEAEFYYGIRVAYDIIAYPSFSEQHKEIVASRLETFVLTRDTEEVILSPQQIYVLDTITEVTGIVHTPGQDTFDVNSVIDLSHYH